MSKKRPIPAIALLEERIASLEERLAYQRAITGIFAGALDALLMEGTVVIVDRDEQGKFAVQMLAPEQGKESKGSVRIETYKGDYPHGYLFRDGKILN